MELYYAQIVSDFHGKEYFFWLSEKWVFKMNLILIVNNQVDAFHHGKAKKFAAAKDIWYPYVYQNNCLNC